ncbi:MAG: nitroreductase family protein [Bacillota bacterium]
MSFLELARKRYSVRKYLGKKVEEEKLKCILEAGRIAPTGANRQPQRIIVVREEKGLSNLSKAANIFGAPLALIICADHNVTWKRHYDGKDIADIDASIVTDHMMLEATAQGLGSVWICHFKPEVVKSEFKLPEGIEPVNILAIGYADGEPLPTDRYDRDRNPLDDMVFFEKFSL